MSTTGALRESSSESTRRDRSESIDTRQQLSGMLAVIITLIVAIVLRSL